MKNKIKDFLTYQTALKESSKKAYQYKLIKFSSFFNGKVEVTEKDFLNVFKTDWFKELKLSTQNLYKNIIREFMRFLGLAHENIKTIREDVEFIKLEELPTEDEIKKLLENMPRAMDRCLLMVFLEGLRLSEARHVKIKDIIDKQTHMIINVRVSKSQKRPVPVINSVPFIIEWLNQHPDKNNPNAYLFSHKRNGKVVQYSTRGLQLILDRNNCLEKRIYPHLFRHTSATHDYGNLTEKEMMKKYGWKTREMIDRYAHLSDTSLEESILQLHGIIPEEKKEDSIIKIQDKICPRCKFENPYANIFCSQCGSALDIKTILEHQEEAKELSEIIKNSEIQQFIEKILEEKISKLLKKKKKA